MNGCFNDLNIHKKKLSACPSYEILQRISVRVRLMLLDVSTEI